MEIDILASYKFILEYIIIWCKIQVIINPSFYKNLLKIIKWTDGLSIFNSFAFTDYTKGRTFKVKQW